MKTDMDMNGQELQRLGDELNQRMIFFYEHSQKTINMVLLAWGGLFAILGAAKSFNTTLDNTLLGFVAINIFFISNLLLYFSTVKGHSNVNCVFRILAHIKKNSDSAPFYSETTNPVAKCGNEKHIYTINSVYAITLMTLSSLGILALSILNAISIYQGKNSQFICICIFLYMIYFVVSVLLILGIRKCACPEYIAKIYKKHLNIADNTSSGDAK